jgi:hypothetical protein
MLLNACCTASEGLNKVGLEVGTDPAALDICRFVMVLRMRKQGADDPLRHYK